MMCVCMCRVFLGCHRSRRPFSHVIEVFESFFLLVVHLLRSCLLEGLSK